MAFRLCLFNSCWATLMHLLYGEVHAKQVMLLLFLCLTLLLFSNPSSYPHTLFSHLPLLPLDTVAMIKRFLKDTFWGRLDYLIIDTPPGTSDEHLSVVAALASVDDPFMFSFFFFLQYEGPSFS